MQLLLKLLVWCAFSCNLVLICLPYLANSFLFVSESSAGFNVWHGFSQKAPTRHLFMSIPNDIKLKLEQIEITQVFGKIDMQYDKDNFAEAQKEWERLGKTGPTKAYQQYNPLNKNNRVTYIRLFEAYIPGGTRCLLKEYLPIGLSLGRREIMTSRRLTARFNNSTRANNQQPTFPILLGTHRTTSEVESDFFRIKFSSRFSRANLPESDSLWLLFKFDEATFKTLRRFPRLPQIVDPMDYFRKNVRTQKRWLFVRKIIRKTLEAVDVLHQSKLCHNALNAESMWLRTTNQQELEQVQVVLTDLGVSQSLSELGPTSYSEGVAEDLYQLGFILLELVLASFVDDNIGAEMVRSNLSMRLFAIDVLVVTVLMLYLSICFVSTSALDRNLRITTRN